MPCDSSGPLEETGGDANRDDALSSDEVPEGLWDRLVDADADAGGSVTNEEFRAYREAQRAAAVEAFFEQLDNWTAMPTRRFHLPTSRV